jgi:hypothetical protein
VPEQVIKYFKNRMLAEKWKINLSKWKRWSREFLPPDPLGGLQSGYARQYSPDEAFTVRLGGILIADLKFSIAESRQILTDLDGWLTDTGFRFRTQPYSTKKKGVEKLIKTYLIFIRRQPDLRFCYTIRGVISKQPVYYKGFQLAEEHYVETTLKNTDKSADSVDLIGCREVNITTILVDFTKQLDLPETHYRVLAK